MNGVTYLKYELVRTFRNRRFFLFSLGFPLVLFFVIAGPNRNISNFQGTGIAAPLYYMIGLAAFGAINAVLSSGARIAAERTAGWNRQLRLTPLTTRAYFRAKVAAAYLTALVTIGLMYVAGSSLGVRLSADEWWRMTLLMLIGLIPFAGLGILIGHLVTSDSVGPVIGGTTAILALLGGVWFPVGSGTLHTIAVALPSYWLVQASHIGLGGGGWSATGWIVIGLWSLGTALAAGYAYRRDTVRA